MKSRVKTWQNRGIWSQQLEHKQVPQWGTEPGVRKGKRSLLPHPLQMLHGNVSQCVTENAHCSVVICAKCNFFLLLFNHAGLLGPEYSSEAEKTSSFVSTLPESSQLLQVLFSATAESLSDRNKYSNVKRIIPGDDVQVQVRMHFVHLCVPSYRMKKYLFLNSKCADTLVFP